MPLPTVFCQRGLAVVIVAVIRRQHLAAFKIRAQNIVERRRGDFLFALSVMYSFSSAGPMNVKSSTVQPVSGAKSPASASWGTARQYLYSRSGSRRKECRRFRRKRVIFPRGPGVMMVGCGYTAAVKFPSGWDVPSSLMVDELERDVRALQGFEPPVGTLPVQGPVPFVLHAVPLLS